MRTLPPEIEGLLDAAGGVPDPFESDAQRRRYYHQDLLDLHDEELDAERIMVGIAKAALLRNRTLGRHRREAAWFADRLAAVVAEMKRRQGTAR